MSKQGSIFTALQELEQVLGSDLSAHFLAHRKALRKPMTAFAGKLMANKLRGFPDPVAAVEQAILKGWTDVYPVEAPRQQPQPRGIDALRADLARRITADELQGTQRAGSADLEPDRGLPILSWQGLDRPH